MTRSIRALLAAGLAVAAIAVPAASAGDVRSLVKAAHGILSPTGAEAALSARLASLLPKALAVETDGLGSLYARLGTGGPIVAAGLDSFGYVVGGITAEGYLTLDKAVAPPSAIFDSFLIGRAVTILTKSGPVQGVVAQPAMHLLSRERRDQLAQGPWLEAAFVDVAARSEAEVRARGIELLDPVCLPPVLSELADDRWAGPAIGKSVLCAALVEAAGEAMRPSGAAPPAGFQLAWMAQSRFPARGSRASLGASRVRSRLAGKTALLLDVVAADRGETSPVLGKGPVLIQAKENASKLRDAIEAAALELKIPLQLRVGAESALLAPFLADGSDAVLLALPARYAGTPAEMADMKDADRLARLLTALLRGGRVL